MNEDQNDSQTGNSLPELLVGLTLLGAVITTAGPFFSGILHNQRLRHEARKLQIRLEDAALRAKVEETPIRVSFWKNSYEIQKANNSKKYNFPDYIQFISSSLSFPLQVFLYPGGTASPKRIELQKGAQTCQVIISLRGRVRYSCS